MKNKIFLLVPYLQNPKGSLIGEVGQLLIRSGYRVKVLNTINFSKSMKYNPFRYLYSEKDVLKLVNTLICNTKGEGEKSAEDFWVKSERLFYTALIGYIWQEAPEEEMNFTTLLEMINASEAREDDPEFQSPVDLMFERLEERDPDHFAVRQYKKFLLSAGKTRSSTVDTPGNLIDIDANLLQLGGLRPDVAGVHVDNIPVNEHFPGIGGKVLRVELGHFLLDQGPFFRRHRDAQHNVSCSVCHSFTVLSEQGFGAFPNKQPATARRDRGGPVFGSVATLPMLATFLFLRY